MYKKKDELYFSQKQILTGEKENIESKTCKKGLNGTTI